MHTLLGIEIGGTKLQLVAGTPDGGIRERVRAEVRPGAGAAAIREQLERALPGLIARHQPLAIGTGFGGPVNHANGRVARSHQIEGWSDFPLGEWLGGLTRRPVAVENDANVAALGEAVHGAGRNHNPVFYLTMGSGVGGGLVVDGRIYHGRLPGEAEIGHVRLDPSGVIVEERCSGWAVDRQVRDVVRSRPDSALARLVGTATCGEARFLSAAVQQGDASASRILDHLGDNLGFALSHVAHLFHPGIIVLGGGVSLIGEPLRGRVERALRRFLMDVFQPGPVIALAGLGEDAVPVGALVLAGQLTAQSQPE